LIKVAKKTASGKKNKSSGTTNNNKKTKTGKSSSSGGAGFSALESLASGGTDTATRRKTKHRKDEHV